MRHDRTPTVLAVTGGTGDFENARGTFTLNERTQRATFKLLPSPLTPDRHPDTQRGG
jgi:hypothetical protein